jgi:hypothetical protein
MTTYLLARRRTDVPEQNAYYGEPFELESLELAQHWTESYARHMNQNTLGHTYEVRLFQVELKHSAGVLAMPTEADLLAQKFRREFRVANSPGQQQKA